MDLVKVNAPGVVVFPPFDHVPKPDSRMLSGRAKLIRAAQCLFHPRLAHRLTRPTPDKSLLFSNQSRLLRLLDGNHHCITNGLSSGAHLDAKRTTASL